MSVGLDYVSELQPPAGMLFISQVLYEYGEIWRNDTDTGKPKNSEKNLYQCYFDLHKSHKE
jgi:hypothetical protein